MRRSIHALKRSLMKIGEDVSYTEQKEKIFRPFRMSIAEPLERSCRKFFRVNLSSTAIHLPSSSPNLVSEEIHSKTSPNFVTISAWINPIVFSPTITLPVIFASENVVHDGKPLQDVTEDVVELLVFVTAAAVQRQHLQLRRTASCRNWDALSVSVRVQCLATQQSDKFRYVRRLLIAWSRGECVHFYG